MRAIIQIRLIREAGLAMMIKKRLKMNIKRTVFSCFFVILSVFSGVLAPLMSTADVFAEPNTAEEVTTENIEAGETGDTENNEGGESVTTATTKELQAATDKDCQDSLGGLAWLVCPTTGKIAEAVGWLYEKLQDILEIKPVSMEDGTPIYEIWKYCLSVTNIVFIIFLLVVIYSQITGIGINNYGIKKVLPKLIITAVLVNLSFLICTLAVDISNIVGSGLRDVFASIEESVVAGMASDVTNAANTAGDLSREAKLSYASMYSSLSGGAALAIGAGAIAFETGAIWMLIPVVLGAIVAVVSGIITIALRQAVVALLIMISPLAMVAYILPNTEQWFKKWKQLLLKMIIFYPMFSLLFGASSLAGFAIMASAQDGFGVLLGVAVQIFPLFFSWSLMKMSGTMLGTINAKMQGLAAKPLATNRAWADAQRLSSKQKHLASNRAYTPSLRLVQFMSDRRISRDADMAENMETVKNRALASNAEKHYDKNGRPTKDGERAYEAQARNMHYQQVILRDKNNMNKGLGQLTAVKNGSSVAQRARLRALDNANVLAADALKAEQARGEKIDYENAMGFHKRMEDAVNAHFDGQYGNLRDDKTGKLIYKRHFNGDAKQESEAAARYRAVAEVMEGNVADVQYVAATAAHGYDTQKKIIETKMQKYFEYTPPTKDVEYRLGELTKSRDAVANIDSIIPGLRVLNQRGDTDLVREQLENVLSHGVDLGSHASQSLASFLMFEVKDNDPFLRRFGKYINLETANVYNSNKRKIMNVTLDEYVKGYHEGEVDLITDDNPTGIMKAKKNMQQLLEGTSLDGMERTAMKNLDDMLKKAYTDDNGLNITNYLEQRKKIEEAMAPQFISASLKYLSGSEQLKSMVSFLTGYDGDGKARWEKGGDLAGARDEAEEYFRERTIDYLSAQTPAQLLNSRSDYKNALIKHLARQYQVSKPEEWWHEDAVKEREEYMAELEDIQTRYADSGLSEEDIMKKRSKDMYDLEEKMFGAEMRRILGEPGKLKQIYKSRTSGAANNAKDWFRYAVLLDDEEKLLKQVKQFATEKRRKEVAKQGGDPNDPRNYRHLVYDENDMEEYLARMSELRSEIRDESTEEFYRQTRAMLKEWFTDAEIVKKYEDYYKSGNFLGNDDLYSFLKELLGDLGNYPGND